MRACALFCCALACGGASGEPSEPVAVASSAGSTVGGVVTVSIVVNHAPRVLSIAAPSPLLIGQPAAVSATAIDADGDPLSWRWSSDCEGTFADRTASETTFVLASQPASGSCAMQVEADDGRGGHGDGTLIVQATPVKAVFAPQIGVTVQGALEAVPGEAVGFEVYAIDPQGGSLRFEWGCSAGTFETRSSDAGHARATFIAPACSPATVQVWSDVTDDAGATSRAAFGLRVPCG